MTTMAEGLAKAVGGSVVDQDQIWAPDGQIFVDFNGAVWLRRHVDDVKVLLGRVRDSRDELLLGYDAAVAARGDRCAPWCDRADGHPDSHPADRSCWLFGNAVPLSLYPEIEWSDDTMRPDHLDLSLRKRSYGDATEVWMSYDGETVRASFEHRFSTTDARALAAELVRLADLADAEEPDE